MQPQSCNREGYIHHVWYLTPSLDGTPYTVVQVKNMMLTLVKSRSTNAAFHELKLLVVLVCIGRRVHYYGVCGIILPVQAERVFVWYGTLHCTRVHLTVAISTIAMKK